MIKCKSFYEVAGEVMGVFLMHLKDQDLQLTMKKS